jgi:hypothetical protein
MHCVLRYYADQDFCDDSRIIQYFTDPVALEHGAVAKRFKLGQDETVQQFAEWSAWSWLQPLCDVVKVSSDINRLQRIGFAVEGMVIEKLVSVEDPFVIDQNAKAWRAWTLQIKILKHRASSMLWHSSMYPGATARLLHTDAGEVKKGLALLKTHVEAWEFHRVGNLSQQRLAKRSMFEDGQALKHLISYGRLDGYSSVNEKVQYWLQGMWGGILHTLWNERANQKITARTTTGLNNSIGRLQRWATIADVGFIANHGLKEMEPCTHIPVPANMDSTQWFKHSGAVDHGFDAK